MRITGGDPKGWLVAKVDRSDGTLRVALRNAHRLAVRYRKVVHFDWNGVPLAVAADSDINLIVRAWQAREAGNVDQIGPHPDPKTTPEYSHGIMIFTLG